MNGEKEDLERRVWRRMTAAVRRTSASRYLQERTGLQRVRALISRAFAQALWSDLSHSVLWRSAFPKPLPQTPREQSEIAITSFWVHLHPAFISRRALRFSVTFGLGGLAVGLFLVLVVTGVLLMFYYVPSTNHAYKDMVDLEHVVSLGKILRNMHRWAAHAMVIIVSLHMLRVYMQKAYESPREVNWVIGVLLLVLTLLLSFTGYLLPWDQLAFWAITVGTNMAGAVPMIGEDIKLVLLGGPTVDQSTLLRFYVLHDVLLPVVLTGCMVYHFWRVRKDGFSGGL